MTDTKDLLAQASAALDAERAAEQATVDSLTAANIALQAQLDTANATIASLDPWASVDKGASLDVTDKFQSLIDQGFPVPAGRYLIDAVKGVQVTGLLKMDPQAVLIAKPNNASHYCIVDVAVGGTVQGGQIIGDRDGHTYPTTGGTDEWGYGIFLRGDGAKALNVQVSKCTGDGIGVSGDRVEIRNVSSRFNRRQGMSVFSCAGLRVYDSQFTDTSGAQNGPCAGVDFEPDKGSISDAIFERCEFNNNRVGFEAWMRNGIVGGITGVELRGCKFDGNPNHIWTKDEDGSGPVQVKVIQSSFTKAVGASVKADGGSVVTVGDADQANANTFGGGATLQQGIATRYDIVQINGGKAVVGWNKFP